MPRELHHLWILFLFLTGLVLIVLPSSRARAENEFRVHNLQVPGDMRYYVAEELNNDGLVDFVVFHTKGAGGDVKRLLSIFFQNANGFSRDANQTFEVDKDIILFDVGDVVGGPEKEIVFFSPGGVYYYSYAGGRYDLKRKPLIKDNSIFLLPDNGYLPYWNFVTDVNGDGVNEVLIPQIDGCAIYAKGSGGKFFLLSKIRGGVNATVSSGFTGGGTSISADYRTDVFKFLDYNNDGRRDIVCVDKNGVKVFLQGSDGTFPASPDKDIMITQNPNASILDVVDVNKDGLIDVVVENAARAGFLRNAQTDVEVYFGRNDGSGGSTFADMPDQTLSFDGVQVFPELAELQKGGNLDLVVSTIEIGVGNIFSSLVRSEVKASILFHRNAGRFSSRPDIAREVSVEFKIREALEKKPFFLVTGNYNADGIADLLIGENGESISVYYGERNGSFKNTRSFSFGVPLPNDGRRIRAQKLDRDSKDDLIITYEREPSSPFSVFKVLMKN